MTSAPIAEPRIAPKRILAGAVAFLAFLGIAMAARRAIVLVKPGALSAKKNPAAQLDAHFADHRGLTFLHIIPGALFMILGPLQFLSGVRAKHPAVHRWSGRVFLCASAIIGVTGLTMGAGKTIGGADEKSAILIFGSFFLFALCKAFYHAVRRQFALHREWMIRGFATGLAVATVRPVMATFFAVAVSRGETPRPAHFFGTAFWIGFVVTVVAAELWVHYTRGKVAIVAARV